MVLGKRINNKNLFLMQQLSIESVPDLSLPPCIFLSHWRMQASSATIVVDPDPVDP
jgi:hypothetical protein